MELVTIYSPSAVLAVATISLVYSVPYTTNVTRNTVFCRVCFYRPIPNWFRAVFIPASSASTITSSSLIAARSNSILSRFPASSDDSGESVDCMLDC